jgi:hypothetical protein
MTKRLHLYDGPGKTRCGVTPKRNKYGDLNWSRFDATVTCQKCKALMKADAKAAKA